VYRVEIFATDSPVTPLHTTVFAANQPDGVGLITEMHLVPGSYRIGGKAFVWHAPVTCPPPNLVEPAPDLESAQCDGGDFAIQPPTATPSGSVSTFKPIVSLTCDFVGGLAVGGAIIDATSHFPTTCDSSVAFRGDDSLAVCAESSCGSFQAAFTFTNICRGSGADLLDYWLCGPMMWTTYAGLAKGLFPVSLRAGVWQFGVLALDRRQLATPEPAYTDPSGNLLVFRQMANPIATLERTGGLNQTSLTADRRAQFVARLRVQQVGSTPEPELVLIVRDGLSGANTQFQTRFGPCDVPTAGVSTYSLHATDVRLVSASRAELRLGASANAPATHRAFCDATLALSGVAVLTCSAAEPLP
jgi:hypothetical protein